MMMMGSLYLYWVVLFMLVVNQTSVRGMYHLNLTIIFGDDTIILNIECFICNLGKHIRKIITCF